MMTRMRTPAGWMPTMACRGPTDRPGDPSFARRPVCSPQTPVMSGDTAHTALCREIPDLPIFLEPWYLDALAPGWKVATVEKRWKDRCRLAVFSQTKRTRILCHHARPGALHGAGIPSEFDHEKQWYKLIPEPGSRSRGYLVFRQDAPIP